LKHLYKADTDACVSVMIVEFAFGGLPDLRKSLRAMKSPEEAAHIIAVAWHLKFLLQLLVIRLQEVYQQYKTQMSGAEFQTVGLVGVFELHGWKKLYKCRISLSVHTMEPYAVTQTE